MGSDEDICSVFLAKQTPTGCGSALSPKKATKSTTFATQLPGNIGFHWSEVDPEWEDWEAGEYKMALDHPVVEQGFQRDFNAMQWADAFVLVMPCGRSAHLEAGWAIGQGKPTCVLLENRNEPELMYKMADHLALTQMDLLAWANKVGVRAVANLGP